MRVAYHQIISANNYRCFGITIVNRITKLPSSNTPDTFLRALYKTESKIFSMPKNYPENIFRTDIFY